MDLFGDPASIERLGTELNSAGVALERTQRDIASGASSVVPGSWYGSAAAAFQKHCAVSAGTVSVLAATVAQIGGALNHLASELRRAQELAHQAEGAAQASGLSVGADGRVSSTTILGTPLDPAQSHARGQAQGLMDAALLIAGIARSQANSALSAILVPPAEPPGTTPAAARSWAGVPMPHSGSSFWGDIAGVAEVAVGGIIALGGAALDETGIGAVAGVPAEEEGVGLVTDAFAGGETSAAATSSVPRIVLGEIKGVLSYRTGLVQLAGRNADGADALATYDSAGNVHLQVWDVVNGQRRMVFDEDIGQVDNLPSAPPGTTTFGNEMEPLVRSVVERATGQVFRVKAPNAPGPDLTPN